jgi:hypothetical protein
MLLADNGVTIQKPHLVGVPYFVFRLCQSLVALPSQKVSDVPILRIEGLIVRKGVGMHNCSPSGGTRLILTGRHAGQDIRTAVDNDSPGFEIGKMIQARF